MMSSPPTPPPPTLPPKQVQAASKPVDWREYLPDFETLETAEGYRDTLANVLRRRGHKQTAISECRPGNRCGRDICQVCTRYLREELFDFVCREQLYTRRWYFVTIRVAGWKVAPGDLTEFQNVRRLKSVANVLKQFGRKDGKKVLVIGSIETLLVMMNNVPAGKPWHVHMMVSGLSKEEIDKAVRKAFKLDKSVSNPLDIQLVKNTLPDFFNVLSYCYKSCLVKKSKRDPDDWGVRQRLTTAELYELACNIGWANTLGFRYILKGILRNGVRLNLHRPNVIDPAANN